MQLGPPGRWWDDPAFASDLHLRPEQQTRMDAIFAQNKSVLFARFDSLRQEERQLATISRGANIDEHALFAQIDRVSQARAELEKANAHMLLLLRHELTADQVTALDDLRPPPPR
jgi:Spy/CpxP family protein refolding chaperone